MSTFDYRRHLSTKEQIPLAIAAAGAGLVVFYVARVLRQREPLDPPGISGDISLAGGQARKGGTV